MFIKNCADRGIETNDSWGWVFDDIVVEFVEGDYAIEIISGNSFKMVNSKIISNEGDRKSVV